MDSGLHVQGQTNSIASLIANRIGYNVLPDPNANFTQPWINEPGIGSNAAGSDSVATTLYWNGTTITYDAYPESEAQDLLLGASLTTPYDNLGVPGAWVHDVSTRLTKTTSTGGAVPEPLYNPFFDFILRNPSFGNVTMQGQAAGKGPSLVTLWIGNNDVLGGATSGNPVDGVNITPASTFEQLYGQLLETIDRDITARFGYHPTIVLANIPSVTAVPFFIPWAFWSTLPLPQVTYEEDPNNDGLIASVLFTALGLMQTTPPDTLGSEYTLTNTEAALVSSRIGEYNTIIANLADQRGLEVVDVYTLLNDLPQEQKTHFWVLVEVQDMPPVQAALTTYFSLDGIHPNNQGYAYVANAFIVAINAALGLQGSDGYGPINAPISNWDPTYGRNGGGPVTQNKDMRFPSRSTTEQMSAIFRH